MKEILVIKNFGPIKSIKLEFGRFNILIGKNATGKSTVAKILSICRYFSYIVQEHQYEQSFMRGLMSWGLLEFVNRETYISYDCPNYLIQATCAVVPEEISRELDYLPINLYLEPKSEDFKILLAEASKLRLPSDPTSATDYGSRLIPATFYQNEVGRVMDNPFYLPAERGLQSIFSIGKGGIQNISDSLFVQLGSLDQILKTFNKDTDIGPLDVTYRNERGKGLVRKNDESSFYSMYNAATGYQSTIPIILTLKYYTEIRKKRKTFIIEEPEENLFPDAQNKLIEFLVDNVANFKHSILLTTHSPYVLTSINNSLFAYKVGQTNSIKVENVVDKKYWLDPQEVSAYILKPNGYCEDIFDTSENLIKADRIDEISGIINERFNTLLNIEYSQK